MYLRLALTERDEGSRQGQGVFTFAYELMRDGGLPPEDSARLKALLVWFERNLPLPDRSALEARAIFWFKAGAGESARRVWELARLVTRYGSEVEFLRTTRPGQVVYEDDHQVAAIPYRDTFLARMKRKV